MGTLNQYLKSARKRLKATTRFFSSKNKFERECWIVKKFLNLTNLNEFIKPDRDPPDVIYQNARFEVIEILDEGRRRNDEHRERAKKIEEARKNNSLLPLVEPYELSLVTKNEIIEQVLTKITDKERKYAPSVLASLDLLVYVNFRNKKLDRTSEISIEFHDRFTKWRSVSVLMNIEGGFVLYSGPSSPHFLKTMPKL